MVICLEQGADLHTAQLMPLPLSVSCFSKIHVSFTFLVPAHPGSPGKRAVKRACVCVLLIETGGRAEPPKLSLDERFRQVRAHVGGTAKVSVGVEGEPAPAVTWYKDAAPLRARSNVVVDVGDSSTGIVMRRLTREDAGDYEVVAKNDWGTTKERFSVAVVGMCDVYFF